jgi:hypothetical protein
MDKFFTTQQAAKIFGCTPRNVLLFVTDGKLIPELKTRSLFLFGKDSVYELHAKRQAAQKLISKI